MDHVGDEAALHALPALLDGDVSRPHQGEDVSGQLGEGVLHVDGVAGRRLHVAHSVRARQLLRFLAGHLEGESGVQDGKSVGCVRLGLVSDAAPGHT